MKKKHSIRKTIALVLSWLLLFTSLPFSGLSPDAPSYAALTAGPSADGKSTISITSINFVRVHNGFDTASAYVEIRGTGLKGTSIDIDMLPSQNNPGGYSSTVGTKTSDTDAFLKYNFTSQEALLMTGKIAVGTQEIDLQLGSFPTASSVGSKNINYKVNLTDPTKENLVLNGTNLDKIKRDASDTNVSHDVKAIFGRTGITEFFYDPTAVTGDTPQKITVEKPQPPENAGFQNIKFQRDATFTGGASGSCSTSVSYFYGSSFRFLDDPGLANLQMFPNTGGKGDTVYFDADYINSSKTWGVYFLKDLDGSDDFTQYNKADFVSIVPKSGTVTKDRLIVTVPDNVNLTFRNYYVVITNLLNGEVVAAQTVTKLGSTTPDTFTVVDAGFKPTIDPTGIFPTEGPDTGASVQIRGRNILTATLPGLTSAAGTDVYTTPTSDKKTLHVDYLGGAVGYTYNGEPVKVTRDVKVQIGKEAKFQLKQDSTPDVSKGVPDTILVTTDQIDDAATSPTKDVVIDVTTTITETKSGGKTYVFRQFATKKNGFTFIPSTLDPTITKVSPPVMAVGASNGLYKWRNQTYLSIEGSNFLVQQYTDAAGNTKTRYPSILIKKNSNNTMTTDYQLAFFPNPPSAQPGGIRYKDKSNNDVVIPGTPDITVLNNAGDVVTGLPGNDVGTRILLKIPAEAMISDTGSKHVQVTNPQRGNDNYGGAVLATNALEIKDIDDAPAISSVDPNILTIDGGQDVKVTGKNFTLGLKMYLDGKEITGFTRTVAPGIGGEITLTFKSPKSRECLTQLLLLNPSGGTAVRSITYVKTLQNAPILTSFVPQKGIVGSMVMINGENFQQPDPTVSSLSGLDANRVIGTRVFFGGKDVNTYNTLNGEIQFLPYSAPKEEDLFFNTPAGAEYSSYKDNTVVTLGAKVITLGYDSVGNPLLTDGGSINYVIKSPSAGVFNAYDLAGTLIGPATLTTTAGTTTAVDIGADHFTVVMNNKPVFPGVKPDGTVIAKAADYVDSIILQDDKGFYSTLMTDLKGNVVLSNGKDNIFTITYDNTTHLYSATKADGSKQDFAMPVDAGGICKTVTVGTGGSMVTYTMLTPYKVQGGKIIGNNTKVITKNQISFTIPVDRNLGYNDVTVSNPDTKSDSKVGNEGFFLIGQPPASFPFISNITPNKGSVAGGYNITINGSDFKDGAKVYIDAVLVPATDTYVALDKKSITVRVPKCSKDLAKDFNVDHFSVPVIVVNDDGASAFLENGFTYLIPISAPVISKVIPTTGSANGGQIVEILGSDFRFFEPYEDTMKKGKYVTGDIFTDLYVNPGFPAWDDLLAIARPVVGGPAGSITAQSLSPSQAGYDYYYASPILPKIYFGEKEAKIVEFSDGYLKVLTPAHAKGNVELFVVNNDYGVSNKMTFTYTASSPKITSMVPNKGRRTGQEVKDVYGSEFYATTIKGYTGDVDTTVTNVPGVQSLVRFGSIDNRSVPRDDPNSGMINNNRATVNLLGGLKVEYLIDPGTNKPAVKMTVEEGGNTYTRTFFNYDPLNNPVVYLPMGMLKSGTGAGAKYYVPYGYTESDGATYNTKTVYEYIRVSYEDRAMKVERGYAPKVAYDNKGHVAVTTPSYYTIDPVTMTIYNDDGGSATTTFTYTNPASIPKIYQVQPFKLSTDGTYNMVEGALNGNIEIEVLGKDLRKGATVSIGGKPCTVVETTTKTVNGVVYDLIIAKIPTGTTADIDLKYPVVVENTDGGLANSATQDNLISPDGSIPLPIYFQYRKPLSGPKITTISPAVTSINGGNTITITGTDFRTGAYVIIGSRGGVPVKDVVIGNNGTTITFKTPTTLTLGDKDIQVINSDFGIDTKTNGLKVVSYPQTTAMYNEKHNSVSRLSTEGGETITIIGSGFMEGARVIFGGTSTVTSDPIGSTVGLWKNDAHYLMKDGVEGTNVTVLDGNSLTVKTPAIKTEGPVTITVINSDSGISDSNLITQYRLPIPSDVTTLSVKVIDNKYIQLYDYTSTNLDYYEIYYYIGQYSEQTLRGTDNYQDFKLLEVTDREPYKILDLPGYESKKSKDYIWFVVKAVNKYGASNYSNLAYLTDRDVKDLVKVGAPDLDGPAGVPKGKEYLAYVKDNVLAVDLSDSLGNVSITLTSFGAGKYPVRQINLPVSRVLSDYGTVQVDYGDSLIRVAPVTLNTSEFATLNQSDKAYGQITSSMPNNNYSSTMKQMVPRNLRMVSPLYQVEFAAVNNKSKLDVQQIKGQMQLQFDYGRYLMTPVEESKLAVYKYNSATDQWQKIKGNQNKALNQISIQIKDAGAYMILANK